MPLQRPPRSLWLGKNEVRIDADFRRWASLDRVVYSDELTDAEKENIMLFNVYGFYPKQREEAMERLLWFYSCAREQKGETTGERLIDWRADGPAVWADFKIWCRVDLCRTRFLHWWEFMALFTSLPGESEIKRRISLRAVDLSRISDPQTREQYRAAKAAVALESAEEDWDDFYGRM